MAKKLILLTLAVAACARPADKVPEGPPQVEYSALGQEPGWALRIDRERMSYIGTYGDTRISVARPVAVPFSGGLRYQTSRLTVDVLNARCNDAMSGRGFEDQVTVYVRGQTFRGCGGARRVEFDN